MDSRRLGKCVMHSAECGMQSRRLGGLAKPQTLKRCFKFGTWNLFFTLPKTQCFPVSTTPYSLLPTPYSLLPTPYSLLPTPYSLFPIPYSLFPIPYSLLPIPYSLSSYSAIRIPRSAFYKPLTNQISGVYFK